MTCDPCCEFNIVVCHDWHFIQALFQFIKGILFLFFPFLIGILFHKVPKWCSYARKMEHKLSTELGQSQKTLICDASFGGGASTPAFTFFFQDFQTVFHQNITCVSYRYHFNLTLLSIDDQSSFSYALENFGEFSVMLTFYLPNYYNVIWHVVCSQAVTYNLTYDLVKFF